MISGLLCIGALNRDVITLATPPAWVLDHAAHTSGFRPYGEMPISDRIAGIIVQRLRSEQAPLIEELGGSAFNVLRVARQLAPTLRCGYIGVSGRVDGRSAHADFFDENGVETEFVLESSAEAAISVSFVADNDRTLFTSTGANSLAHELLTGRRSDLETYAASFDSIHVTSFLDERTPVELANLLEHVTRCRPEVTVSVDPGHAWAENPTGPIERLIRSASMLHLNSAELSALGGRVGGEPDDMVLTRIYAMMRPQTDRCVVVRWHDSVLVSTMDRGGGVATVRIPQVPQVSVQKLIGTTGAGDAFTGGLLASLVSPLLRVTAAAQVGFAVAQAKIAQVGVPSDLDAQGVFASFARRSGAAR